eukprot:8042106-Heterocapsa_arctica.AAC.1
MRSASEWAREIPLSKGNSREVASSDQEEASFAIPINQASCSHIEGRVPEKMSLSMVEAAATERVQCGRCRIT